MKILVATDGSSYSEAAVRIAAERLWPPGSELRVLSVMEPLPYGPGEIFDKVPLMSYNKIADIVRRISEQVAATAATSLRGEGRVVSHIVRDGAAAKEIIDEAKDWGADLILIGTHGRRGISRFLLGSVSERVAAYAPCSVEIVRKPGNSTKNSRDKSYE